MYEAKQPLNKFLYKKTVWKFLIFLFPILFIFSIIIIKCLSPWGYRFLVWHEDSPVEFATSIAYFFSSIISFSISYTSFKRKFFLSSIIYLFFSIGFMFLCWEEISWGQRIFNMEVPDFFITHNRIKEINIHNISGFARNRLYMIVGFCGAFAWLIIPNRILKARQIVKLNIVLPDYLLFFYFFTVFALYLYCDFLSSITAVLFGDQFDWGKGHFIVRQDQKPAEFLLSCGLLFFMLINKIKQNNWKKN
jgi:hypothetical protein